MASGCNNNTPITLLNITWLDILFPNILSRLSFKDLFHLRCCSSAYKNLVDNYFAVCIHHLNSKKIPKPHMLVRNNSLTPFIYNCSAVRN